MVKIKYGTFSAALGHGVVTKCCRWAVLLWGECVLFPVFAVWAVRGSGMCLELRPSAGPGRTPKGLQGLTAGNLTDIGNEPRQKEKLGVCWFWCLFLFLRALFTVELHTVGFWIWGYGMYWVLLSFLLVWEHFFRDFIQRCGLQLGYGASLALMVLQRLNYYQKPDQTEEFNSASLPRFYFC